VLDAFAIMLEDKMKLQEWERDLVFMQNEFKLLSKDGRLTNKKYDMVVFGRHNNLPYSAISLLVSMPCAITAQLILDGKIKETGVLRPTSDVIIQSVLGEVLFNLIYLFLFLVGETKNLCDRTC
jgi:saccharopine dehydrogenase-like NADP-dependent oxidoreductase